MTARPARCPLAPVAILNLADTHATSTVKRIFSFSKRNVSAFAQAIFTAAINRIEDAIRPDMLEASIGLVTGQENDNSAYPRPSRDVPHPDLRTAMTNTLSRSSSVHTPSSRSHAAASQNHLRFSVIWKISCNGIFACFLKKSLHKPCLPVRMHEIQQSPAPKDPT